MRKLALLVLAGWVTHPVIASEWSITLGGIYAKSDSTFEASGVNRDGTIDIDFERDLNLGDTSFLPEIEIQYQFADRHSVSFSYVGLHRSGTNPSVVEPFEIEWIDDNIYRINAGAAISTDFNYDIFRLYYTYDFYRSENFEAGVTAGLHIVPMDMVLKGNIDVCVENGSEQVCDTQNISAINDSITAPLPNFGLEGSWGFAPQWDIAARGQVFYIEVDSFSGGLLDLSGQVGYTFTDNWRAGLGYGLYYLKAVNEGSRADLSVDVVFHGMTALVEYSF